MISGVRGSSNVSGASTPLDPSFIVTADKQDILKQDILNLAGIAYRGSH